MNIDAVTIKGRLLLQVRSLLQMLRYILQDLFDTDIKFELRKIIPRSQIDTRLFRRKIESPPFLCSIRDPIELFLP